MLRLARRTALVCLCCLCHLVAAHAAPGATPRAVVLLPAGRPVVRELAVALEPHRAIDVRALSLDPEPGREELLGRARARYAQMDFARTLEALKDAEHRLIDDQRPTPARM